MRAEDLMRYKGFYDRVYKKVMDYIEKIQDIGFAFPEAQIPAPKIDDVESLAKCIEFIMNSNIDLNRIFEVCPDSVYVVDKVGNTIRVNKAFEHTTGVSRVNVINDNVYNLEKKGYFMPSVNGIALREKRTVTIIQMGMNGKETIVTGVPVFDNDGELFGSVSNAKLLDEINRIIEYFGKSQKKYERIQSEAPNRMICESVAMRAIMEIVDHIIDIDSSVLITGETGVGKGMLTRYIHDHSKRREHRLVEINCGAIPETLLESELYGYESGAFTGADKRGKPGLIELADGGTIFFDEISELPLMLQVKLLHFLQNKKITRVGGTNEILVDARIIAASNKNLEKLVLEGKFRADLYYRLNVIPIEIPPLRERPEDLISATEYYLEKYNKKYGRHIQMKDILTEEFLNYDWPGNLRELENFTERKVVTSKVDYEVQKQLDDFALLPTTGKKEEDVKFISESNKASTLNEALEQLERNMILESYHRHKNSYKVAEELGISQASAHRKIKKYLGN